MISIFARTIWYEKAIGMGAAFAYCGPQARPCDDFKTMFGDVST